MLWYSFSEFVSKLFKSSLSNDEQEALKKIVIIYDSIFEEELREIYHRYAGSFFAWAYGMIEK